MFYRYHRCCVVVVVVIVITENDNYVWNYLNTPWRVKTRFHWRFLLRFQVARVKYWRFKSPVVYTGDLKSPLKSQQKSPV